MTMKIRPERTDGVAHATGTPVSPAAEAPVARCPGFARSRRRALAIAGATVFAPGVRAATAESTAADPPARLRTGWILRPDDR